jgi:superfamily II DNA or RNA helicase
LIKYFCENVFTQERINAGTACGLLNLRAGMGKTFFAAGIIAQMKLRTLYVVPKRPLMV